MPLETVPPTKAFPFSSRAITALAEPSGSGKSFGPQTSSPVRPRSLTVLQYENAYARRPLRKLKSPEAVLLALRALDTASESDSATGGVDRHARVFR